MDAAGPPPCAPYVEMAEALRKSHGEIAAASFIDLKGNSLVVFVSPSGTWSMLLRPPDGPTCFAAAGRGWMPMGHLGEPS